MTALADLDRLILDRIEPTERVAIIDLAQLFAELTRKCLDAFTNTISGDVLGGTNCEVKLLPSGGHGIYSTGHNDTVNTVTTVFDITGGTGDFAGASGDGVLVFTYDTFEPHGLLSASISLNLELP